MGAGTVAGPRSQNGSIEVQLQSNCLRIARIVTPVIAIHSTASAQSRVATLHLIVHELLAFLAVPVMPAPHGIGDRGASVRSAHRTPQRSARTGVVQAASELLNGPSQRSCL